MTRKTLITCTLALLLSALVAAAAPRLVDYRGGTGSVIINGITASTLYAGYWTPPSEVLLPEAEGGLRIAEWDHQQTTFAWMYDTTTHRAEILAEWGRLKTEWDTASEKYSGAFTNSYYVDWATGDDSTGDGSSGNKWKTIHKAVTYIKSNHVDGSNLLDAATEVIVSAGVQYIEANSSDAGTDAPPGGFATISVYNITGTAAKPLVIRGASGDAADVILRIAHSYSEANFTIMSEAKDYKLDCGIKIREASDYIQIWDMTMVGPMFELPYWDKWGDAISVHTDNYSGAGHNKIINCEITQWSHCGVKGKGLSAYGNYVHGNGVNNSYNDHGFYVSDALGGEEIIGNIIMNSDALAIVCREANEAEDIKIVGNIIVHNGGNGIHVGAVGMLIAHNYFEEWAVGAINMGGESRLPVVKNNVFGSNDTIAYSSTLTYVRAAGFVFDDNAKLAARAAPSQSIPLNVHPGVGVAMSFKSNIRQANGHIYSAFSPSSFTSGATVPTQTDGSTVSDGAGDWTDMGTTTETWGDWVNFAWADDLNDHTGFDHRPATGSALLSAGTDIGYGTTIGPFSSAP